MKILNDLLNFSAAEYAAVIVNTLLGCPLLSIYIFLNKV